MATCYICQNTKWTTAYRIKDWDIERCDVCGFARINPLPARETRPEFYSQEKVVSRNVKQLSLSQRFSRAMKGAFKKITGQDKSGIFYSKLSRYLPAGTEVLDIGCGDGSFLNLAKRRFNCTGIEISEYLGSLARRQAGIRIIIGDFFTADLAPGKFDGITLISLLEHLDHPEAAVKKCFDLLKPGGILLIKTVNYGCVNRSIRKENWTGFRVPDHVVYFNPSNLKRLLERTGFSRIKISAWPFSDNMYCDAWK
ncbi:MAG: class I SAM-dependent methyltransferase [Candidatus Omnitrophota bacterium]|nr:class I SAM-dependent methyltransferase [Candidatus Omnitrophota bacterium]